MILCSISGCCWWIKVIMKIVIIENPRPLTIEHYNDVANAPLSASLNSGYALAVARRAGWDAAYLDFTATLDTPETMAAAVLGAGADLILFHWVYSWGHEQIVSDTMARLRRESPAPIGAFGLFPTLSRQQLMEYAPGLDFILSGEFEDTLSELLQRFGENSALPSLPGICLRAGEFVPRPLIDDLATLPMPDDVGANRGYRSLNIAASRGCHGACSFCFIHQFYGCARRRVRPLASLEQELDSRLARRPIDSLYFIDPSFIGQGSKERERVVAISRLARERRGSPSVSRHGWTASMPSCWPSWPKTGPSRSFWASNRAAMRCSNGSANGSAQRRSALPSELSRRAGSN